MPIDDSLRLNKIAFYNPDLLTPAISVASENPVSTLITPHNSSQFIILNYDAPNTDHAINK